MQGSWNIYIDRKITSKLFSFSEVFMKYFSYNVKLFNLIFPLVQDCSLSGKADVKILHSSGDFTPGGM